MNEKKIEAYLKNSDSFLFGVFDHMEVPNPKRDKKTGKLLEGITEIDGKVYGIWQGELYAQIERRAKQNKFPWPWNESKKVPYSTATEHLLKPENLGISGIIKKLILPYQAKIIKAHEIEFLRKCWDGGDWPRSITVENYEKWNKPNKIDMAHFYETNFVEFYLSKENELNFAKGWSQWAFVYFGELDSDPDDELKLEYYMDKT